MTDFVAGDAQLRLVEIRAAGVEVARKAREVRQPRFKADAIAALEGVRQRYGRKSIA